MGLRWMVTALWMLGLGAGCFGPSEEALASLEAVKAEGQHMERRLSNLEDRFLGTQARVLLWRELADRHQNVSALACDNATAHAVGIQQQQQKEYRKSRPTRRLAKNTITTRALQTGQF